MFNSVGKTHPDLNWYFNLKFLAFRLFLLLRSLLFWEVYFFEKFTGIFDTFWSFPNIQMCWYILD